MNRQQSFPQLFILAIFFFCTQFASLQSKIERIVPVIVAKLPHHLPAFTQGLAIEDDKLYESTGLYGQSSLRQLDILTGEVIHNCSLPAAVFGEGIAAFPQHVLQLTWKEHKALAYDRKTFTLLKVLSYAGDGWGLCRDGQTVWMSNGTSLLNQRDQQTFEIIKTLDVHHKSTSINALNDLECVGSQLYANVWCKSYIVRIDKATGEVTGVIDGSRLLTSEERKGLDSSQVLNGIAFRPKTGTFFITGKGWPWIFEVKLSDSANS